MNPIKRQFFFSFTVMGSVLPYLPVFLAHRGLSMQEIGAVMSVTGLGIMASPVLTTLLADWRVQSRTLLTAVFAVSAASLAWLAGARGFGLLMLAHGAFAIAFAPATALQDGLYFQRAAELRQAATRAASPHPAVVPAYHSIRVFGTLGFILPSLLLYGLLWWGIDTTAAILCAAACALAGLLNTFTLPRVKQNDSGQGQRPAPRTALPTVAAARAMLEPRVLVFCFALLLLHLAITAYYSFYPVYLTQTVDIPARWIGLISTLGVVIEIGFILGFGVMLRWWGLRRLMAFGALCMAARFGLLGLVPTPSLAVGTQAFHGIMVAVVHVAPPIYLNHRARDAFRSSIQGLFAMAVMGTGRIAGNLIGGAVAQTSLTAVFLYAAVLALFATALFAFAFHDRLDDLAEPKLQPDRLPSDQILSAPTK
ncbi:MAG: MFS transporter [Planctomycetota bacterium]